MRAAPRRGVFSGDKIKYQKHNTGETGETHCSGHKYCELQRKQETDGSTLIYDPGGTATKASYIHAKRNGLT